SASSKRQHLGSICHSTCKAQLFSSVFGKPCVRSRLAPRQATRKSLSVLVHRRRYAPWLRPVRQTQSPLPFPVIVSYARTAPWQVIAGASSVSGLCSSVRLSHDRRRCFQRSSVSMLRYCRARCHSRLAAYRRRPRCAWLRGGGGGACSSRVSGLSGELCRGGAVP